MAVPPGAPLLDELGDRAFSFYPPILNIEHNEWVLRRGSWSEVLVWNPKMEVEVWIPRRFVGEISRVDHPVMIVGLRKELEYKAGAVWPHERRVIQLPRAAREAPRGEESGASAERPRLRLGSRAESRIGLLIGAVLVAGIMGCFLIVSFFRQGASGSRVVYNPVVQAELGLSAQDDYFAVVRKLGSPEQDRWRSETGERQYRVLSYPQKNLIVILMGAERNQAVYIGAKDKDWKTIHAVDLPGGRNTDAILRSLKPF